METKNKEEGDEKEEERKEEFRNWRNALQSRAAAAEAGSTD